MASSADRRILWLDTETYSSVDLKSSGLFKYMEAPDFEILLLPYAWDDEPVRVLDLTDPVDREELPDIIAGLQDPDTVKIAHNSPFERGAYQRGFGFYQRPEEWEDTMILCAMNGLPLSLEAAGAALQLPIQKRKDGKALINYFCKPCKPTKANGGRVICVGTTSCRTVESFAAEDGTMTERSGWTWVSDKAKEDRAVSCPYSAQRGCMDMWAPDLYNEFAGVCSSCGHHFPMEYQWVVNNCFDEGSLYEFNTEVEAGNPLNFPDFDAKIADAKQKTGLKSGCITFEARIDGIQCVVAVLVGSFRGGSVGVAEGSKFVAAADRARRKRYPFIVYCHGTAGIRIQEGTHGVIQMPRCTVAVRRYIESGGLYLVLYDTKSYGGPVASFLGCAFYQFAIRSSDIGFAGPGVIKNTTGLDIAPDHHNCFKALSRGHIQGVWDRRDVRVNLRQALETMGGRNLYYR